MSEKRKETILWILAALLLAAVCLATALTSPDYQPPSVVYPEPAITESAALSQETKQAVSSYGETDETEPTASAFISETTVPIGSSRNPVSATTHSMDITTVSTTGSPRTTVSSNVPTGPVNINTASREELMRLNGIGETLASRIIEYREQHGGFDSVEELMEVKGIGEKRFEKIRDDITVG